MDMFTFFIFGSQAVSDFNDNYDEFITKILDTGEIEGGMVYAHNEREDPPAMLLSVYDGWGAYEVIDAKTYEEINKSLEAGQIAIKKRKK